MRLLNNDRTQCADRARLILLFTYLTHSVLLLVIILSTIATRVIDLPYE